MSPVAALAPRHTFIPVNNFVKGHVVPKPEDPNALILEAWAQGWLVGSLVILMAITLANMRRGVLLHKLILLELFLGLWQGFWLFFRTPIYAWWLSVSAIFLNVSWSLHNVIAWMKIKPFLSRKASWIFIGTVILAQPYWVLEIYANFTYFHGVNTLFLKTRPWEALCRDPWWVFTTVWLFWTIKSQYEITIRDIIRISPRFGIMLASMLISMVFIALDIASVTGGFHSILPVGINPFWKMAFVFKCLTDSVVLDDFKTALDRLRAFKISRLGSWSQDTSDRRAYGNGSLVNTWEDMEAEARSRPAPALPSPDGDYIQSSHRSHFPGMKSSRKHKEHCDEHKKQTELREHKDSVMSDDVTRRDFSDDSNKGIQPEDLGPSALVNTPATTIQTAPMRTMEAAHVDAEKEYGWGTFDLRDEGHLANELDYGLAMREIAGHSPPISPTKSSFSRRSNPP